MDEMKACSNCGAESRRAAEAADGLCTICAPDVGGGYNPLFPPDPQIDYTQDVVVDLITGDLGAVSVIPDNIIAIVEKPYLTLAEIECLKEWFRAGGWKYLASQELRIIERSRLGEGRYTHNARINLFRVNP